MFVLLLSGGLQRQANGVGSLCPLQLSMYFSRSFLFYGTPPLSPKIMRALKNTTFRVQQLNQNTLPGIPINRDQTFWSVRSVVLRLATGRLVGVGLGGGEILAAVSVVCDVVIIIQFGAGPTTACCGRKLSR